MLTTKKDVLRDVIRETLARHAGDSPDTKAIAAATLDTWHQVSARLAPVIGARGVDALFSRALYLTSVNFPWLAISAEQGDSASQLASFGARLEVQETAAAMGAGQALMTTFVELLASLIGESLTARLLNPVWERPPPALSQETASCPAK